MTTEAPAAEAAPAPEAPAIVDRIALAAAKLAERRAPPVEAPPPAPEPAPAATPEPTLPSLADLEPLLIKRQTERQAQEAKDAERAELEQLRAQRAEWEAARSKPGLSVEGFLQLPVAERRAFLQQASRAVLQPDVAALERRIEQIKPEPALPPEIVARLERIEQAEQAREREAIQNQYLSVVRSPDRFPLLSREDPAEVLSMGEEIATAYQRAGYSVTLAQVAEAAEAALRSKIERLTGGQVPAAAQAAASQQAAQSSAGGSPGDPATVSNDLVASAPASRPRTHEDRIALATRKLTQKRRGG
jgi:hypothetical protein